MKNLIAITIGSVMSAMLTGALAQTNTLFSLDPVSLRKRVTGTIAYATDINGPYYLGPQYYSSGAIHDEHNILVPFDLAGVGTITAATFHSQPDYLYSIPLAYNIDLYGVGYSAALATLPNTLANLFYMGALDGTKTLILADYIVPTPANNVYVSGTSAALVAYLNSRTNDIVWLRLNHDASVSYVGPAATENYHIRFDPTPLTAPRPYLTLTIPSDKGTLLLIR
jgi:hypothetical protein